MAVSFVDISGRFPTLNTIGLAVEYFPCYRNPSNQALHTHGHLEMALVLSGETKSLVAGQEFIQKPGALSVVNYGQTHRILTDDSGAELFNIYLESRTFQFPTLPEALSSFLVPWVPIHPAFVHEQNRYLVFNWDDPARLKTILMLILEEQNSGRTGALEAMQTAFTLFLLEGARNMEALARGGQWPSLISAVPNPVERLRIRIDRQPESRLSLEDLSRDLGMSRSHLCRKFKAHTGKTIVTYLHIKRIEKALHLILTTRRKILDIANECGFADLGQFNLKFKELTGRRPRDFREGLVPR